MSWKHRIEALCAEWQAEHGLATAVDALRRAPTISHHGNKGVLILPPPSPAMPDLVAEIYRFHGQLNVEIPTLLVPQDESQLIGPSCVGTSVLITFAYPEVLLSCIRSAAWVASFDPYFERLCEEYGVPFLSIGPGGPLSWPPDPERGLAGWAKTLRALPHQDHRLKVPNKPSKYGLCTVTDKKYVGSLFGMIENLAEVSDEGWHVYVMALDDETKTLVERQYPDLPVSVFLAKDFWPAEHWRVFQSYPASQRAYASKPRSMIAAMTTHPKHPVYYSDVDVYFYRSPEEMNDELAHDDVLLMPQYSDVFRWTRFYGLYQAGLMGANEKGRPVFEWLAEMCLHFSPIDETKGYYADQGMLDMALWYFPGIRIYRGLDQDVAAWNRKSLGVARKGKYSNTLSLHDGRPVKSFHAAGVDTDGFFAMKFAWDQAVSFFSVLEDQDHIGPLFRNTLEQQMETATWVRDSFECAQRWSRRLRRPMVALSPETLRRLLAPAGQRTISILLGIEKLIRKIKALAGIRETGDGHTSEELQTLTSLQRKYAFSPGTNCPEKRISVSGKR